MTITAPLLQAAAMTKSFSGATVLHGVDLQIHRGELLSVMGPSGSGKSSLLRCLNRLEEPTGGTVRVLGRGTLTVRRAGHSTVLAAGDDLTLAELRSLAHGGTITRSLPRQRAEASGQPPAATECPLVPKVCRPSGRP